jgi:hypothetical protein
MRLRTPASQSKYTKTSRTYLSLVTRSRQVYFTKQLSKIDNNPKTSWRLLNSMLHRGKSLNKPPTSSSTAIAFSAFFKDKVSKLKAKAVLAYSNRNPFKYDVTFDCTCFSFASRYEEQLNVIINSMPPKGSSIDPLHH